MKTSVDQQHSAQTGERTGGKALSSTNLAPSHASGAALIPAGLPADVTDMMLMRHSAHALYDESLARLQHILLLQETAGWPDIDALNPEFNALLRDTSDFLQKLQIVRAKLTMGPMRQQTT